MNVTKHFYILMMCYLVYHLLTYRPVKRKGSVGFVEPVEHMFKFNEYFCFNFLCFLFRVFAVFNLNVLIHDIVHPHDFR